MSWIEDNGITVGDRVVILREDAPPWSTPINRMRWAMKYRSLGASRIAKYVIGADMVEDKEHVWKSNPGATAYYIERVMSTSITISKEVANNLPRGLSAKPKEKPK